MQKPTFLAKFIKRHIYIIVLSLLYVFFSFATYKDYGITYDEKLEYDAGKFLLEYLATPTKIDYVSELVNNNPNNIEHRHLPIFSSYSRTYPALLTLLNPKGYYEWYHLQNLLLSTSMLLGAYALLFLIYKDGKKALLAPILLLITPAISGHFAANPKDVPFATLVVISLVVMTHYLSKSSDKKGGYGEIFLLGLIFGVSQGLRTVGLTLFLTYVSVQIIILVKDRSALTKIKDTLLKNLLIFTVSLLVWIFMVPYLGSNPVANLFSLFKNSSEFENWNNEILYNGTFYSKTERPWEYLFLYTAIQLPLIILIPLVTGVYLSLKKRVRLSLTHPVAVTTIFLFINVVLYLLLQPVVYNTTRHFIYLLCCLVIIASFFFIEIISKLKRKNRTAVIIISSAYILMTLIKIINLYPYQYIYYNELIGGIRGAENKFELDYWGASYKESAEKVTFVVKENNIKDVEVYACANQSAVAYYSEFKYTLLPDSENADIIICDTFNELQRRELEDTDYSVTHELVYSTSRNGVAINNIRVREPYLKYFK